MNIIINGKTSTIDDLLDICRYDDGEYDIDNIFYPMNSETLDKVLDSMENAYDVKEALEKYLAISGENLCYII